MAKTNTADIGFEKQIWDAACVLRGNMDALEYKNAVRKVWESFTKRWFEKRMTYLSLRMTKAERRRAV